MFEKITELEGIIETLRDDLADMTQKKEDLEFRLAKREQELEEMTNKFEVKCAELFREKDAH